VALVEVAVLDEEFISIPHKLDAPTAFVTEDEV
jgi:hypothetical protein